MSEDANQLTAALDRLGKRPFLAVTGAGISAASGIPTFRGAEPEAVWRVSDVELATLEYFLQDPVGQWTWYLQRFDRVETARPNQAHVALASLEAWLNDTGRGFQLVTQNIDTLHEQAGSQQLIKVHGTSSHLRCSGSSCELAAPTGSIDRGEVNLEPFRANPTEATLPRCPLCRAPLRAHVLFFDEFYQDHDDYRFDEAIAVARQAGLFLFIGTSFSVGITDILLRIASENKAPAFSIDPTNPPPPYFPIVHLRAAAEVLLPKVAEAVSVRRTDS